MNIDDEYDLTKYRSYAYTLLNKIWKLPKIIYTQCMKTVRILWKELIYVLFSPSNWRKCFTTQRKGAFSHFVEAIIVFN